MSTIKSAGIDSSGEREDILGLNEQYYKFEKETMNIKRYCFLFPSDYEFEKETLVNMCMAGIFDLLGEIDGWFDFLLMKSYLLFSRRDILRGRILYKVNYDKIRSLMDGKHVLENEVLYACLEDNDDLEKNPGISESWHISLVCSYINQTTFETLKEYGSKLKTLLFIRDYGSSLTRIPPDLFLTLECITTLDLSGSHITELPTSIGNARLMRYLDLSFTLLESLPESIVQLSQLQTLKLQGCKYLYELPKGTKRLIHLRHLDFDVLGQLSFLPEGMGALTNLQTLSAFIINSEEGSSVRELKTMNKLSGRFCISGLENVSCVDIHEAALQNKIRLTYLQLRWNDRKLYSAVEQNNACNIITNLNLSEELRELHIICYPGLELPAWIDFRDHWNLVSITLFKCENKELSLPLGQLPNLKYLSIVHLNRVVKIDGRILRDRGERIAGFPRLENLEIDSLSSIETWTDVSHEDFPCLLRLVIKQCPKLIDLPFLPYLHSLRHLEISRCTEFGCLPDGVLSPSLESLIIDDCPLLEERCIKKGKDWYKIKHVPSIWIDLEDICSIHEDAVDQDDNLTAEYLGFTVSQKEVGAVEFSLPKRNEGAYQTNIEPDTAGFFDSLETFIGLNSVKSLLDESCNSDDCVLPEINIVNKTLAVSSEPEVIEAKVVETDHSQEVQSHGKEEEFDVERVIKKQTTHDMFCPNCSSCITHRVIMRRIRVTGKTSKHEAREVKPGQMNSILPCQEKIASDHEFADAMCYPDVSAKDILGFTVGQKQVNAVAFSIPMCDEEPATAGFFDSQETDHPQEVQSHGEEEFDVERVIKEQTTHDMFCPNCLSCITHRVITRRNRVTGKTSKREVSELIMIPNLPSQDEIASDEEFADAMSCFPCCIPRGAVYSSMKRLSQLFKFNRSNNVR